LEPKIHKSNKQEEKRHSDYIMRFM